MRNLLPTVSPLFGVLHVDIAFVLKRQGLDLSAMYIYHSIPYFLAAMVVVIVTISVTLWRRGRREDSNLSDNGHNSSTWLLVGLLFVSIFALGAFVMYALLSYVG
jgi:hypothetical protein